MFDRKRFSQCIKDSGFTSDSLYSEIENRGIEMSKEALLSYRKGNTKNPPIDKLDQIASIMNCSIQDFFSDADKKREQIAFEELSTKPEKYSNSALNSFLMTIPNGKKIKSMLENFLNLTEEQQDEVLESVKKMAHKNLKF